MQEQKPCKLTLFAKQLTDKSTSLGLCFQTAWDYSVVLRRLSVRRSGPDTINTNQTIKNQRRLDDRADDFPQLRALANSLGGIRS